MASFRNILAAEAEIGQRRAGHLRWYGLVINPLFDQIERRPQGSPFSKHSDRRSVIGHDRVATMDREGKRHRLAIIKLDRKIDVCP